MISLMKIWKNLFQWHYKRFCLVTFLILRLTLLHHALHLLHLVFQDYLASLPHFHHHRGRHWGCHRIQVCCHLTHQHVSLSRFPLWVSFVSSESVNIFRQTDVDTISLFFSIEYLVDDVQKVFDDSINAIATKIILEETDSIDAVLTRDDLTYELSISIFSCKSR